MSAPHHNRRPTIARINARLNVGGIARHVTWLSAGLNAWDYRTLLIVGTVPPNEEDMSDFALAHGVTPLVIPEMSREVSSKDIYTIWKLFRLFRKEEPDIIHTHAAKAGTVGRLAAFLHRWLTPGTLIGKPRTCRVVHTFHGHIFHSYYGPWKTWLFLTIERLLARIVTDRIIVISPQQYREIQHDFRVGQPSQYKVIRLGLDLEVFDCASTRRQAFRQELGVGDRDLLIGIVGRLTEIKNHFLFLQAIALWKTWQTAGNPRRVRFVVIGDGHLRAALETQTRLLGIEQEVIFLGMRADPETFYPGLDAVALSSLNEGTPLTLIEAMANHLPFLATQVGGVIDLVGEVRNEHTPRNVGFTVYEHGILVPPKDPKAFAQGLQFLIEEDEERKTIGECGRSFVERTYSRERLLADVRGLYEELLAMPRPEEGSAAAPSTGDMADPLQQRADSCAC